MSIIFFISWIWFPNASHSITTLFVTFTRSPWRLNSISWALKKNFLWGVSRPRSLIEEAGNKGIQAGEDWICINGKMSLNFFACPYFFFFFQCKVFLVPCFNLSFTQMMTYWKKRPFQSPSLALLIHCSMSLPFQFSEGPLRSPYKLTAHIASASLWNSTLVHVSKRPAIAKPHVASPCCLNCHKIPSSLSQMLVKYQGDLYLSLTQQSSSRFSRTTSFLIKCSCPSY